MSVLISYQFILQREYNRRFAKNPSYSMRAFSRDIDIAPPKLSAALRGKGGFSPAKAKGIAARLQLPESEQELFISLVASKHARSHALRKQAILEVEKQLRKNNRALIEFETFQAVSDWHHFAILELFLTHNFRHDPEWIGVRFGISAQKVEEALARMEHL